MSKWVIERWLVLFVSLFLIHETVTVYLEKTKKPDVHYLVVQMSYPQLEQKEQEKEAPTEKQKWSPSQDRFGEWPWYSRLQTVNNRSAGANIDGVTGYHSIKGEPETTDIEYRECKYCKRPYLFNKKTNEFLDHYIFIIHLDKEHDYRICIFNIVNMLQRYSNGELIELKTLEGK